MSKKSKHKWKTNNSNSLKKDAKMSNTTQETTSKLIDFPTNFVLPTDKEEKHKIITQIKESLTTVINSLNNTNTSKEEKEILADAKTKLLNMVKGFDIGSGMQIINPLFELSDLDEEDKTTLNEIKKHLIETKKNTSGNKNQNTDNKTIALIRSTATLVTAIFGLLDVIKLIKNNGITTGKGNKENHKH